jgi:hypothetical protein
MKEALGSSETRFPEEPHGITSQKTPFFIVTEVKTSNLTQASRFIGGAKVGPDSALQLKTQLSVNFFPCEDHHPCHTNNDLHRCVI